MEQQLTYMGPLDPIERSPTVQGNSLSKASVPLMILLQNRIASLNAVPANSTYLVPRTSRLAFPHGQESLPAVILPLFFFLAPSSSVLQIFFFLPLTTRGLAGLAGFNLVQDRSK